MKLAIILKHVVRKNKRWPSLKKDALFECDTCKMTFRRAYDQKIWNKEFHFHDKACQNISQSSGALKIQKENHFLAKFGLKNPQQVYSIRKQTEKTNLERYGFKVSSQAQSVKNVAQQTNIEKFGVNWCTQLPQNRIACNSALSQRKRFETKKRNGTLKQSHQEDAYYKRLCEQFGENDVLRHVFVNGWDIDFYVKSEDIYVQHDGSYYHGLDRPIEVIKEFKTATDKTIFATWLRDKKQNAWFAQNGIFLMRVVDYDNKI